VERENAFRVADLVVEAERLASDPDLPDVARDVQRLLQEARIRAQPLDDPELDDRMQATNWFALKLRVTRGPQELNFNEVAAMWYWTREAIANVRAGLVPHLASPRLLGRRRPTDRAFPTFAEVTKMGQKASFDDDLVEWRDGALESPQVAPRRRRLGHGAPGEPKRWWRARE
jgi:hypothetical protein